MKFKVGDKVKVKGLTSMSDPAKKEFVGQEFTIKEFSMWANWPYVLSGNASNFNWSDDELELIFTKSDLKDGMIVEYRNGKRALVLAGHFVNKFGFMNISSYNDDLINIKNITSLSRDYDIMRVYTVNGDITGIGCIFDRACLTLIWEREEEPKHKEMTIEEIEKELGYKVKVVGDASCQK